MSGVTNTWTVANFGNTLAMRIFFFLKMFKIWWRFHKWNKKPRKSFLFLRLLDLNKDRQILTIRNRILVIGSPCVNKQHHDFKYQSGRYFPNYFSSQWWKNMLILLSLRFTSIWNHLTSWLSKDALRQCWIVSGVAKRYKVANLGNTLAMKIFFFLEIFKIWWRLHKWNKKPRKCFFFLR